MKYLILIVSLLTCSVSFASIPIVPLTEFVLSPHQRVIQCDYYSNGSRSCKTQNTESENVDVAHHQACKVIFGEGTLTTKIIMGQTQILAIICRLQ